MKEFDINELRGRYHQKNFSQPSPQGTVYPWELTQKLVREIIFWVVFEFLWHPCE